MLLLYIVLGLVGYTLVGRLVYGVLSAGNYMRCRETRDAVFMASALWILIIPIKYITAGILWGWHKRQALVLVGQRLGKVLYGVQKER